MKKLFFLVVLFSFGSAYAQNVDTAYSVNPQHREESDDSHETHPMHSHLYHINPWVTSAIIVGGGAADLLGLAIERYKPGITDAEFAALNTSTINPFDRWALRQSTTNYTSWENVATIYNTAAVLLPLSLFINSRIGKDWGTVLAMYLEVQSVSLSLYMASPLGPLFQNKLRPIVYYTNLPQADRANGNNRNSFYSGHTASVAAATFFMAKVYSDYHPELGADKFWLYGAAAVPPLVLGYIRMLGLNHFPSDILTGFGIGTLCGILIPELHKFRAKDVTLGMYSSPLSTGLALSMGIH